jgi:hypothetical protein
MYICDESQALIPAQVKQGGWNTMFWPASAFGSGISFGYPEWILMWRRNIYMSGTTNVYSHAGETVRPGLDRTPCIAKDMTIRVIKTRI